MEDAETSMDTLGRKEMLPLRKQSQRGIENANKGAQKKEILQKKGKAQDSDETPQRQRCSSADNRDSTIDNRIMEAEMKASKTDLRAGSEVVKTLAECLITIGYPKRLEIIQYCLTPRSFTDIVINLKLNPASFKFHSKVLIDCDLLERVERGIYRTTELGKLLLELLTQANALAI